MAVQLHSCTIPRDLNDLIGTLTFQRMATNLIRVSPDVSLEAKRRLARLSLTWQCVVSMVCRSAMTLLCVLLYCYVCSIFYRSEAVLLTCDDTTDICPGTELICTCTVPDVALFWYLPGSVQIAFTGKDGVGSNEIGVNGIFFVIVTKDTGGKESVLKYNATESLVNEIIKCANGIDHSYSTATITVTFAGIEN